jgi:hypothetical protein
VRIKHILHSCSARAEKHLRSFQNTDTEDGDDIDSQDEGADGADDDAVDETGNVDWAVIVQV